MICLLSAFEYNTKDKIALVYWLRVMRDSGFRLFHFDVQDTSPVCIYAMPVPKGGLLYKSLWRDPC